MIIDLGCVAFALGAPDGSRLLGDGRPARTYCSEFDEQRLSWDTPFQVACAEAPEQGAN
jgi:hypothetical protein